MAPKTRDDLLHVLWGAWIVFCLAAFPVWAVPVMVVLPREIEQTYHALDGPLLKHILRFSYWYWKVRDLAGFLVGGVIAQEILKWL